VAVWPEGRQAAKVAHSPGKSQVAALSRGQNTRSAQTQNWGLRPGRSVLPIGMRVRGKATARPDQVGGPSLMNQDMVSVGDRKSPTVLEIAFGVPKTRGSPGLPERHR